MGGVGGVAHEERGAAFVRVTSAPVAKASQPQGITLQTLPWGKVRIVCRNGQPRSTSAVGTDCEVRLRASHIGAEHSRISTQSKVMTVSC